MEVAALLVMMIVPMLLAWYYGYLYGWHSRGKAVQDREAMYDWMHKYAIGEATMTDAPWRKPAP